MLNEFYQENIKIERDQKLLDNQYKDNKKIGQAFKLTKNQLYPIAILIPYAL